MKLRLLKNLFPSRTDWQNHKRDFLLCLLSGLFGAIIFHQDTLALFAWVALVPYFSAIGRLRGRCLVWGTYIFGLPWHYLSLWWLHTLTVFHWIIPLGVVALAIIEATYFLWFAIPAAFILRRLPQWAAPWLLALLWAGMEYLRTWTDFAFPWNFLGHSQAPTYVVFCQMADVAGVYWTSFLIALTNALIAAVLTRTPFSSSSHIRTNLLKTAQVVPWLLLMLFTVLHARANAGRTLPKNTVASLRVAIVQPNISQLEKWDAQNWKTGESEQAFTDRFNATAQKMRLSAEKLMGSAATRKPQLYILPETVFLSPWFAYQADFHQHLKQLAQRLGADIFFGADNRVSLKKYREREGLGFRELSPLDRPSTFPLPSMPIRTNTDGTTQPDVEHEEPMAMFNSAWLVTPERGLSDVVYNKVQLVPFGEMTPLVGGFQWFQDKLAIVGQFNRGLEYTTFETSGVRYGAVICFESSFATLTNGLARAGARMLCVLTNDAWYDPKYLEEQGGFWGTLFRVPGIQALASAGPDQHFAHSVFRAIETRLPVVRSANSGISAVISPSGRLQRRIHYGESGNIVSTIDIAPDHLTFYARHGDWFARIALGVLAVCLVWQCVARFRTRTS